MFHGGSSILKFSKKSKNFQKSKNAENRSQKYPKVFWTCFGANFFENFLGQCFMEGRFFEKFQKIKKLSKFQPKTHKNRSQKKSMCFEHVLGHIFRKIFDQFSMEGRVFENFWKKPKIFKVPKKPKIVTKSIQTCFERVLGQIFGKILGPVFHGGSRLRKFSKKFKKRQNSENVQNRSQKCPKMFWTCFGANFCKKFFCPLFHGGSRLRKISKKIKKISKFQKKTQNRSQTYSNVFWMCFGANFWKKF